MKSENPVKQPHPRSKKPDIRKINNDEGKILTQEELDFQKYVDVDPGLTASTLVNGNSQKPPKHA